VLKQRVITAVILTVVLIGTILLPDTFWLKLLLTAVLFVAVQELLNLTVKIPDIARILAAAGFAILFWISLSLVNPTLLYWQSLAGVVLWALISVSLLIYRFNGHYSLLQRLILLCLGLDLIWICIHCVIYVHNQYGAEVLLYLLTLVSFADIGAYFSGRHFGKNKLAPAISPGKTWEGVIGGVLFNLLWMLLVFQLTDGWGIELMHFLLIGLLTTGISVVGDLFESILKREAGVKDSGSLLPGHGGILDRVDGLISAAPIFLFGLFLVAR
jgi:phosphatidate cytidylyltransferase